MMYFFIMFITLFVFRCYFILC